MLDVQGLSVSYGEVPAVWDVSFTVQRGELVAIIGSNGAGKTTTLRAVLGLSPARAGSVRFEGRSLDGLPPHRRVRAGLSLVPEGRRVFPRLTVEENLALGAFPASGRPEDFARAYALFPILRERRAQAAGTLSGGEQQMLAIARALMATPKLLMLDEPSLGLAPLAIEDLYRHIVGLKREGLTMLLVEQFVFGALEIADRAYVMETGRIVRGGTGAELLRDDSIQRTYLAV